jgi:hypothetical protein
MQNAPCCMLRPCPKLTLKAKSYHFGLRILGKQEIGGMHKFQDSGDVHTHTQCFYVNILHQFNEAKVSDQ